MESRYYMQVPWMLRASEVSKLPRLIILVTQQYKLHASLACESTSDHTEWRACVIVVNLHRSNKGFKPTEVFRMAVILLFSYL